MLSILYPDVNEYDLHIMSASIVLCVLKNACTFMPNRTITRDPREYLMGHVTSRIGGLVLEKEELK
jgi:hypothetical protein